MILRAIWRTFLPAAALAAGTAGCFATREDVATLQNDFQAMRAASAHADSARQAQLDTVRLTLGVIADSLRGVDAHILKWQGDVRGDLYSVQQELLQIQELTGQSQRKLQELRAQIEARSDIETAPPPPSSSPPPPAPTPTSPPGMGAPSSTPSHPSDTTNKSTSNLIVSPPPASSTATSSAPTTDAEPGPNQLFQLALDQLRRGSNGAARAGFSDLVSRYPNADVAADAQFYIAETYTNDGNTAAADSGYLAVVSKYPASPRAPTALYKHAMVLKADKKTAQAKSVLSDVIAKYPHSDEAVLAKEQLQSLQ